MVCIPSHEARSVVGSLGHHEVRRTEPSQSGGAAALPDASPTPKSPCCSEGVTDLVSLHLHIRSPQKDEDSCSTN